jgi:hypothetical protein
LATPVAQASFDTLHTEIMPTVLSVPAAIMSEQKPRWADMNDDDDETSLFYLLPPRLPLPRHMWVPKISKKAETDLIQRSKDSCGRIKPLELPESERDTIAINITETDNTSKVIDMLNGRFMGQFRFIYVIGRKQKDSTWLAKGVAFVVFINPATASEAKEYFDENFSGADWALRLQGYSHNVSRYRNSDIMLSDTPCEFQPVVFDISAGPHQGCPVEFPKPTRPLPQKQQPQQRKKRDQQHRTHAQTP